MPNKTKKRLVVTGASLVVTSALLVVTMFAIRNKCHGRWPIRRWLFLRPRPPPDGRWSSISSMEVSLAQQLTSNSTLALKAAATSRPEDRPPPGDQNQIEMEEKDDVLVNGWVK